MQDMDDQDIKGAIGEEILDQIKAVMEVVGALPTMQADIAALKGDVAELKSDMKIVKAAVTEQSRDLHRLDERVSRLEAA